MQTIWQDLKYGLRVLLKQPGVTAIAVLSLALGIGANTAIFSIVNAVLLRSLPYPHAEQLMQISQSLPGVENDAAGEPKFLFWREHNQTFAALAIEQPIGSGVNLAGGSEPEYVSGVKVSKEFFDVLGIQPALGRGFTAEEDRPGGERVAVISNGLWRRRFGADAGLIGKTISINSDSFIVVGILPQGFQYQSGFQYLRSADVFVPLRPSLGGDPDPNYRVIGRLRPEVTPRQAQADMQQVAEAFRAVYPAQMQEGEGVAVAPLHEKLTAGVRPLLLILLGAVGIVLLIACANVANLQLVRAAGRQKEMAIRLALGANWRRLMKQLLSEGMLLALAGGGAGLLLAIWGIDALAALIPERLLPRFNDLALDWRVLAFTLFSTVVTGIVFSLAPALQARRLDVSPALKEGGGKGVTGVGRGRLRRGLVVVEVALSLMLLTSAALLIRTFVNLRRVEPGFETRHVLTFQISPTGSAYNTTAKVGDFYRRALERLGGLPGVEAAAVTSNLPLSAQFRMPFAIAGQPEHTESVQFRLITPEFFRVMQIPLQQGRAFADTDTAGSGNVAIVNQAFARKYLSDTDALGQTLTIGRGPRALSHQIIGVVGNVKQFALASDAPPMMFIPAAQAPDGLTLMMRRFLSCQFVVRAGSDPATLAATVKQAMADIDPALPVSNIRPMQQIVSESIAAERFNMALMGLFAGLGLMLAAIGLYGVMSYAVTQRTHEIGVRMALGARPASVLSMVIRQGVGLALVGVGIGLIGAFALTRLLTSLLFGVSATDPLTFAVVSLILLGVALGACFVPARRATRVDPMIALRYE
ncbi:MAG TPA: ABC transporter permease [Blastocatellia bacterium]|nr:ABC transporter permease [Blastocatellia bacterium]